MSLGILVDDGNSQGYAYKLLVPAGSLNNSVIDISSTFLDDFEVAKRNADVIDNTYTDNILVSQTIIKNSSILYEVTFTYTNGIIQSKTISKILGDTISILYTYNQDGSISSIIK